MATAPYRGETPRHVVYCDVMSRSALVHQSLKAVGSSSAVA